MECAVPLNEAAKAAGITLEVRLEVDTGAKRTGVQRTKAAELAKEVHQLSNLNLTGIYTFTVIMFRKLLPCLWSRYSGNISRDR